ncbi:hypothetical protein AAFF_G00425720 [Aldrovandia affinis]|uniref:Coiled-coil domain-containing protein 158-like n=1 Tax=Aldrovandia affinis TaxID=143900 RepID=A0AAD7T776_9TELE|nr:hypothetical protein AAFF_G00425720 [Aldrovandia affinis]
MLPGYQSTNVNVSKTDTSVLPNSYSNVMSARSGSSLQGTVDETAYAAEIGFDAPPKRSTNLDMLSVQLERQTRVTQKLQEQVEHATKRTMERMGRTLGSVTPLGPTNFKLHSMDVLPVFNVPEVYSSGQDFGIQPVMYGDDLDVLRHSINLPGRDVVDEYSQQVSELQHQLSATHDLHEQQNYHLHQCIMKLQKKLQDSEFEMDTVLDQRVDESQRQTDLLGKLQGTVGELQASKIAADQMLLEAENQVESLCRKQVALEQTLQEVGSSLVTYEKQSGKSAYLDQDATSPDQHSLGTMVGKVLQDLEAENADLKGKLLPMEEQLEALKLESQEKTVVMMKEQTERMKRLLTSHDQEVALLTDKLNATQDSSNSVLSQVEQLQKQAERQTSMNQNQKADLESAISSLHCELLEASQTHRERVASVEEQFAQALSKTEEAQKERDLCRQQAKDMDSRVCQLTMDLRRTQEELALEKEQSRRLLERDRGHSAAIESLRQELHERSLGVMELEALVGSLKEECQSLMQQQKFAEKHQSKMQENATRLRGELKSARDQLQLTEDERASDWVTREGREREEKRLRGLQQEQEGKVTAMQCLLEEQGRQVKTLQGQVEEQAREAKRLQGLVDEHEQEAKKLKGQLEEQDCEGKRVKSLLEDQEYKVKRLKGLLDEQRQKGRRAQGILEEKEREEKRLQGLLEEQKVEEKRVQDLLEGQCRDVKRLKGLLEDRVQELKEREQAMHQEQARVQEAQGHTQALKAEGDILQLKLEDKEKMVEMLQLQMEGMTQLSLQHSHTIDMLQEEKKWLISETDKQQLEILQLKAGWEQRSHILGALEQEQSQQKGTLSEKTRTLHELTLDKQRLTVELEVQHVQLDSLKEEHEALMKTHISKIEELEDNATNLRGQLQSVHADLYQAQTTLRTLEGADEHGMKVALGMQRRITAKREQIDTLQSRIQMLEETSEKLTKEKRQQAAECKRQSQELASVIAEKQQLETAVETLHYLEKQLRDKVGKLEAALDKMSERFSECQDFIQQQEQEFMRLKLQHALDVKELQGQNLRANGNLRLSPTCNPSVPTYPLRLQNLPLSEQDNPTLELRTLVKELRNVIEEDERSSPMDRSPSERARRPELNEVKKDGMGNIAVNRKTTSSRDLLTLQTADLQEGNSTFSSNGYDLSFTSPPRYTSSPRGLSVGRRSPVHSLLVSTPHPTSPTKPRPEKGDADLNTKMSSMIKTEETMRRRVKDRSKHSSVLGSD